MESDQTPTSSRLIDGLFSRRWARPALSALATAPYRQSDLIVKLVAVSGNVVHSRSLHHAMSYLQENHLIVRHDDQPGLVTYEITDLGRKVHSQAVSLEHAVQDHPDHTEPSTAGDEDAEPDAG